MPKMIQIIGFIFFLTLGILLWAGILQPVSIDIVSTPKRYGVYAIHTGSYREIDQTRSEVLKYLKSLGVEPKESFGMYFNNPDETPEELLTSWIGFIVDEKLTTTSPFYLYEMPEGKRIYSSLTGHPILAPYKFYPALERYLKLYEYSDDGPIVEIYSLASWGRTKVEFFKDIKSSK